MRLTSEGLTDAEIASRLGLSGQSVRQIRYEARRILRDGKPRRKWTKKPIREWTDRETPHQRRIREWNLRRDVRAGERCARCLTPGHVAEACDLNSVDPFQRHLNSMEAA